MLMYWYWDSAENVVVSLAPTESVKSVHSWTKEVTGQRVGVVVVALRVPELGHHALSMDAQRDERSNSQTPVWWRTVQTPATAIEPKSTTRPMGISKKCFILYA